MNDWAASVAQFFPHDCCFITEFSKSSSHALPMYQVLARKYRPKNFHQLLGQEHVSQALINAIDQRRLHHAYLFTGTRGVGKTTIARILAKCLNCETGVTSEPCGVCNTCQAIDAGRFIDLIEIDAASRTKVEDTRELLDNVPYAPTQGRYKVYLIDEVHMLSMHSFNALLKTLEEPPEHVKFLLATTDPQKLPVTIISRCLQFVLRPMLANQLVVYLGQILRQENIGFDEPALWQLANSAKGSVRDALSLTDQAIAFGGGVIHADTIEQMLGLIDQADLVALLSAIATQQLDAVSTMMRQLRAQVVDAKAVMDTLADILHQVALVQVLPALDLAADMGLPAHEADKLVMLARQIAPPLVQLYYDIIVKAREQLALANTPQQALDMCLLRLLAFKPLAPQFVPVVEPNLTSLPNPNSPNSPDAPTPNPSLDDKQQATDKQNINPMAVSQSFTDVPTFADSNYSFNNRTETLSSATQESDSAFVQVQDQPNANLGTDFGENLKTTNQPPVLSSDASTKPVPNAEPPVKNVANKLTFDGSEHFNLTVQDASLGKSEQPNIDTSSQALAEAAPALADDEPNVNTAQAADINTKNLPDSDAQAPSLFDALPSAALPSTQHPPQVVVTSPFDLLRPTEQVLDGDWTPAKWDYWVYQARENSWLNKDELTLAKQGNMQGAIHGVSEFTTADAVLGKSGAFEQLVKALSRQFSGITVTLTLTEQQPVLNTPEQADDQRKRQAHDLACVQISQSPVMQALSARAPLENVVVSLHPHSADASQSP